MDIYEIRRERFREVMRLRFNNSQTEIAKKLEIDANYISRILSLPTKKGHKRISGDYAREIEPKLGLPRGHLDDEASDRHASSRVSDAGTLPYHGYQLGPEAARFAAEWEKLPAALQVQVQALVHTMVAELVRDGRVAAERKPGPKTPRNQPESARRSS